MCPFYRFAKLTANPECAGGGADTPPAVCRDCRRGANTLAEQLVRPRTTLGLSQKASELPRHRSGHLGSLGAPGAGATGCVLARVKRLLPTANAGIAQRAGYTCAFLAKGYDTVAIDASVKMVEAARVLTDCSVLLMRFQQIEWADEFESGLAPRCCTCCGQR